MGAVGVKDVAAVGIEMGDAVLAAGMLGAVDGAAGEIGCQLGDGDAEYLVVEDVVNAELPIWNDGLQPPVQPLDDLPEEDAALGERIQKPGVRTAEKVLRQQVQDAVGKLRRGEDFVVAQVGNAVEDVRVVVTVRHRQQR